MATIVVDCFDERHPHYEAALEASDNDAGIDVEEFYGPEEIEVEDDDDGENS